MQRYGYALLSGGLFGAGLRLSGMTDTLKVQGFLDLFGTWDPTLAFVMVGAILPMAAAWRVASKLDRSYLNLDLPPATNHRIDRNLIIGSLLFGMGWALAGLCPGPALASISFGGNNGVLFLLAMLGGMVVAPVLRARLDRAALADTTATYDDLSDTDAPINPDILTDSPRNKMDIRALTPTYAVSPQIEPSDLAAIKAAGFTTVIDNRPDGEIPPHLHTDVMKAAAEAEGLTFVANPVIGGALTQENLRAQAAALAEATGPVFAYCASGNRCSVVWALMNAGQASTDDLINTPAKFGYNLEHLRGQIDALAAEAEADRI
ncbi:MAG: hypothetical protein JWS11_2348 [Cypionkella sp.]|nr:hypothetical protein [Cypionkella sp.]